MHENRAAKWISLAVAAFGSTDFAKKKLLRRRKAELYKFIASDRRCAFPAAGQPHISVVILAYNHAYHTLQCLLSLLPFVDASMEVIVFDNGSTDETQLLLARFDNLIVHKTMPNRGFIKGMNAAAALARGAFLFLFNNDARMIEGSISQAVDEFERDDSYGYMGVRVVHANGGLQEAGCMIFQDGHTNCYLRYQSPQDPRALFSRQVDFCSGVALLVNRRVFLELGGFDEYYAPAYYEETDFCMKLRQKGLQIIYNPKIVVEHFEFGSEGASAAARGKIKTNREKFLNRWGAMLRDERYFPVESVTTATAAARRLCQKPFRLLLLDATEFDVAGVHAHRPKQGTLSIYLINCSKTQIMDGIALTNMQFEFSGGNPSSQLQKFLRQRDALIDEIVVVGRWSGKLKFKALQDSKVVKQS